MRFSRTIIAGTLAVLIGYVIALEVIFEPPVFDLWYISHITVYSVFAFILLMLVWGVYPMRKWRISLFVFLSLLIILDVAVFIKDIDPHALKVHKEFSAEYGVVNSRGFETTVTYSNKKNGDLLNIYKLSPSTLPEATFKPEVNTFDYRIDENGFRNTRHFEESDVIYIGDSMTIASSLAQAEGWPAVADDLSGFKGYNLGVNQIGPNNYAKLLKGFGPGKKAAVISFFEGNDYDKLYYEVPMNPDKKHLWYWLSFMVNESKAQEFIPLREDFSVPIFEVAGKKFPMIFYEHYANILQRSPNEITEHSSYNSLKVVFSDMKDICIEHEINCVFLYIPTKLRVYMPSIKDQFDLKKMYDDLGNPLVIYHDSVVFYMDEQEKIVRQLLKEYAPNIEFVSATEQLRKFAAEGELVYYPYDTHLNTEGNLVVGSLVAEAVKKNLK